MFSNTKTFADALLQRAHGEVVVVNHRLAEPSFKAVDANDLLATPSEAVLGKLQVGNVELHQFELHLACMQVIGGVLYHYTQKDYRTKL